MGIILGIIIITCDAAYKLQARMPDTSQVKNDAQSAAIGRFLIGSNEIYLANHYTPYMYGAFENFHFHQSNYDTYTRTNSMASFAQKFTKFLNHPTGPKTTHFWGPVANWGFVVAVS